MSDVLHFAFEYYDRGWSLIPLVGKRPPRGFVWKRYQTSRASLDFVKQWFQATGNSYSNVGILTGAISGIIVVDCDTAEDASWWAASLPSTPLVSVTGRGGAHMFYRTNPDARIGNRASVLGRCIDIRGEGGYVCAPPSIHPDTKTVYKWHAWDHYALDDIPEFDPAWLGCSHNLSERTRSTARMQRKSHYQEPRRVRSVQEVLREHPRSRRVQRIVARLDRAKDDRSRRDYAIVCELIRMGFRENDIWSLVHRKSKFATDGWRYFATTFHNASQSILAASK